MTELDDHQLAAEIAQSTGGKLVDLLQNTPTSRRGWGGLEYEGDAMAHHHIVDRLRVARPNDAVLSEEGIDDPSRLRASRVWIVDPLDGSSDFGYSPHWAVHIAMVIDGVPTAAAVAVPGWGTTWATDPKPAPITSDVGDRPRIVVSRSRSHHDGRLLQDALNAEVMAVGSAGVKAMAVVRGDVDAYVHGGGLYEWDSCAPVAVARAAGLVCCRTDGAKLEFNKPDPWSPGLVISRPELVDDIVDVMT